MKAKKPRAEPTVLFHPVQDWKPLLQVSQAASPYIPSRRWWLSKIKDREGDRTTFKTPVYVEKKRWWRTKEKAVEAGQKLLAVIEARYRLAPPENPYDDDPYDY